MNKSIWIVLAVVVILGLGGFLLLSNKTSNTKTENTVQKQNSNPTQAVNNTTSSVSITSSGFEPATVKIKAGTRVVWTNKSGGPVTVNSDPHPTHTLWPFLNLGKFDDGGSVSVVFEKPGTYTYHNHFNPEQKGTVVVE